MADIIHLHPTKDTNDRHASGEAFCLACKHTWVAVAPLPVHGLECPSCLAKRGQMKYEMGTPAGEKAYTCNCGSYYFYIQVMGKLPCILCADCGTEHRF